MSEKEKKEIDILASDIDYAITSRDISLEDRREIAKALVLLGYGKVEDYKKQIETDDEYERNLNNVINLYLEKERTYKKEIVRLSIDNSSLYDAERKYLLEIKKLYEENKELRTELSHKVEDCKKDKKIYFIVGETYTVISFIKLHTKFNQNVHTIRVGRFVKETDEQYFFDKFYVRKSNIVKIIEGNLFKEYGVEL